MTQIPRVVLVAILCSVIAWCSSTSGAQHDCRCAESCDSMSIGMKIDPSDVISQLVYVTKTGKKYHKGDCRFLKTSKFAVKLEDAKKNYSPCSICKPPK